MNIGPVPLTRWILGGLFVILVALEMRLPLRRRKASLRRRWPVNLVLIALVFGVAAKIVNPVALGLSVWTQTRGWGLLHLLQMPSWIAFALGFLLMDLTFYYWHRANHQIPLLWRFHAVHHVDPDLDVTTSFRFHLVEILYSTVFRVIQVGLLGVTPMLYITYELVFTAVTMIQHSNVRWPLVLERWVNKVLVTPRMHGIHHSTVRKEMNANFSVIFRWWDQLHRTLRLHIPQSAVDIGVAAWAQPEHNRLMHLLVLPFRRQPDYWTYPDGRPAQRPTPPAMPVHELQP